MFRVLTLQVVEVFVLSFVQNFLGFFLFAATDATWFRFVPLDRHCLHRHPYPLHRLWTLLPPWLS